LRRCRLGGLAGYPHGVRVALEVFARGQIGARDRGLAKERFAVETAGFGHRHEGDRVEPVAFGKLLGLGQGFAGADDDQRRIALDRPVIDQFVGGIGRQGLDFGLDLIATGLIRRSRGQNRGIANLGFGQHQLCADAAWLQPFGLGHQARAAGGDVVRLEGQGSHRQPAAAGAMQKLDAVIRQLEGEIRFHMARLSQPEGAGRVIDQGIFIPIAGIRRCKEKARR